MPELAECTWAEFSWARCVAATRAFGIRDARPLHRVLVPMVDVIDHHHDPPCRWTFDPDGGTFLVEALRSIEPGEEIFLTYRRECVCRFLVPYGFVPDGAIDCVTLGLRVDVATQGVRQTMTSDEHALADAASTQRMLEFFRMAHVGEQPVTLDAPIRVVEPVSLDEEAESLEALVAHCDAALARLAAGSQARARRRRPLRRSPGRARACAKPRRGRWRFTGTWGAPRWRPCRRAEGWSRPPTTNGTLPTPPTSAP